MVLQFHNEIDKLEHVLDRDRAVLQDDSPVLENRDLVGQVVRFLHQMRGEHNGLPSVLHLADKVPDVVPVDRVEAGGRLVETHDLRVAYETDAYRHSAAHSPRELADFAVLPLFQVKSLEDELDLPFRGGKSLPSKLGNQQHVLLDGQVLPQRVVLGAAGDFEAVVVVLAEQAVVVEHESGVGLDLSGQHFDESRLAGAVVAQNHQSFVARDVEADRVKRNNLAKFLLVGFGNLNQIENVAFAFFGVEVDQQVIFPVEIFVANFFDRLGAENVAREQLIQSRGVTLVRLHHVVQHPHQNHIHQHQQHQNQRKEEIRGPADLADVLVHLVHVPKEQPSAVALILVELQRGRVQQLADIFVDVVADDGEREGGEAHENSADDPEQRAAVFGPEDVGHHRLREKDLAEYEDDDQRLQDPHRVFVVLAGSDDDHPQQRVRHKSQIHYDEEDGDGALSEGDDLEHVAQNKIVN